MTALLLLRPPAKLCVSTPSPGCWINAAMSIITSRTTKESWRGELGRPNKRQIPGEYMLRRILWLHSK